MKTKLVGNVEMAQLLITADQRLLVAFNEILQQRGIKNRQEGIRQLMTIFVRQPEMFPIGLKPVSK
jgi:metal-responsive CopG/Arc/MetJ family transcriptional regulator